MVSNQSKTLKGLAEQLGISITTVSRALANHPSIAVKTRARVTEAARSYGYVPNQAARQLVSGRSGFVGFVLSIRGPNFVDSFIGAFITGLGEGLVEHGIDLFIATAQAGQSELSVLKHMVESGRADGIVLPRVAERDERVEYLLERGFPFVTHGRVLDENLPINWMDSDSAASFSEAFELLYALGHRHFGLVSISEPMTFRHFREQGLRDAIARCGDPEVRLDVVHTPRFDRGASVAAVNSLLHGRQRPTAILGLFDELALLVMEEAARAGLSIPHDLSVVGFDNILAANYAPPGLTTFDANIRKSGREIGAMLISAIETPDAEPQNRLFRPALVLRASHGPAPQTNKTIN